VAGLINLLQGNLAVGTSDLEDVPVLQSTRFTLGIYPNDVIMADCKNNSSTRIVITELRETGDNLNALK